MALDLSVPLRFSSLPEFRTVDDGVSFLDYVKVPVPCDAPGRSVVPICLDTEQLRVGDVFLFHQKSFGGKLIEQYQRRWVGLSERAAGISHVAVYAGRGMIWDHNPGQNIRVRTVSSALVPGTTISVARPTTEHIDKSRLASICSHLQNQSNYDLQSATNWRAVLARANKLPFQANAVEIKDVSLALVCSTFVATALDYASRGKFTIPVAVVLPGDFVREDCFTGLDIEWCCLPH